MKTSMVGKTRRQSPTETKQLPVMSLAKDLYADVECLSRYSYDAPIAGIIRTALRELIDKKADDDPKFKADLERNRAARRKLKIVEREE